MFSCATFFVVSVLSIHWAHGQLPIPRRELGFVYKPKDAAPYKPPVILSFFIDNTCDDSQKAYPTLIEVAEHFGSPLLRLQTHLFSLPYHRNSHTIAKGAHVINAYTNGTATYLWFKTIYDNLDKLTTSATSSLSDGQVMDILAHLANKVCGIPQDTFKSQVQEEDIDQAARLGWKYCCTRGIYGTPSFMVNDVLVPADPSWTVDQWMKLIVPLI